MKNRLALILFLLLSSQIALAQERSQEGPVPTGYVKKFVVFPMDGVREESPGIKKAADDTWWKVRETLTDTKRFLVASRRFMVQKDAYQPRNKIATQDAILLGQLLECDVTVTLSLQNRELHMSAYSRHDGSILWSDKLLLHSSIPIEKQLLETAVKLTRDFIATIPFQGLQILDPIVNKPIFEEGDVKLAKVDVGTNSRITEGDVVQWLDIEKIAAQPLYQGGGRLNIIAEGQVVKNENGILLVDVRRARDLGQLQTNTLVRIPKEAEFLTANFGLQNNRSLQPELRYTPLPPTQPEMAKTKPLATALATIATFVALLLLAF